GLIYEDVTFPFAGFDVAEIENLLSFKSQSFDPTKGPLVHRFDYRLDTSLTVDVLAAKFPRGLDIDDCFIQIESAAGGAWKVTGLKKIHFSLLPGLSAVANAASPAAFRKVLTDLSYDLVCCPAR